ncbi:hypothetical protein BASA50_000584 [Batrachochytrium salamandrivorans]|uniref:Nucleoporin Nup88 n=1 Tax=Batrachochytrium salamandrivorans TaxID=1357716 RepID=A0ABQ8EW79_9FUNG|nr:hypothetical protein BASA60_001086 [Batrachochytrium salamandrivorans]KAH6586410.1 hypothetical protein BASA50_000584 [Batrachochytrium salamandrivorans]KAH6598962.1 hypothetical protein BASA61_002747 [Batrachochytrium salamandrivorans]KAH9268086.1 hypothetical protein BASA83_009593 [Batrachochytrium salamandrivorans]
MTLSWIDLITHHPVTTISSNRNSGAIAGTAPATVAPISTHAATLRKEINTPSLCALADISAISLRDDQSATFDTSVLSIHTNRAASTTTTAAAAALESVGSQTPSSDATGPCIKYLTAQSDGNLYICLPCTPAVVRYMSLREWKRMCAKATVDPTIINNGDHPDLHSLYLHAAWKELVMPGLDFTVNQMQLSPSGRVLALAGDRQILVAILPVTIKSAVRSLECRTHFIGDMIHSVDLVNRVSKILWHPLSETGTHLVVLSSNAVLRIYDVASSSRDPEQTIPFGSTSSDYDIYAAPRTNKHRFGSEIDDSDAVSFCFGVDVAAVGSNTNGSSSAPALSVSLWSPFTIYALMRNGDIVALCPVTPSRMRVPYSLIAQLKADTEIEWGCSDATLTSEQSEIYWRMKWIQDMMDQMQVPHGEGGDGHYSGSSDMIFKCVPPRSMARWTLAPRGPYLIQPALPMHAFDAACDILCLSTGVGIVLVVASEGGVVHILLELDSSIPKWCLDESNSAEGYTDDLPILAVLETVNLAPAVADDSLHGDVADTTSLPDIGGIVLVADPKYPDVFYAYHSRGVHMFIMAPLNRLADAVEAASVGDDQTRGGSVSAVGGSFAAYGELCSVRHLVSLNQDASKASLSPAKSKSVVGLVVITENLLGYSYLLLTSDAELFGDMLAFRVPLSHLAGLSDDMATSGGIALPYKSVLMEQPYQIPKIFHQGFPRQPKLVGGSGGGGGRAATYPAFITTQSMTAVASQTTTICEDLQMLYNAKGQQIEHLDRQVHEYSQQLTVVGECTHRLEKIAANRVTMQQRLDAYRIRHKRILSRLDLVLQILVDQTQPELSAAEIKWVQELRACRRLVNRDLVPSICEILEKTKDVTKRLATDDIQESIYLEERLRMTEVLGSSQIIRIRNSLKDEYMVLSDAARRAEALQAAIADAV